MDEWNAAVDEYISSGVDMRMREEIENESKIGLGGGPLHALCENEMCLEPPEGRTHHDGRSPTKLLVCTGCKMVGTSEARMKIVCFFVLKPLPLLIGKVLFKGMPAPIVGGA